MIAGVIIALLLGEIISAAYFLIKDGRFISVSERLISEKNEFVRDIISKDEDCDYIDSYFPHPYLGFVHHKNEPCGMANQTNNVGLFGRDYPIMKLKDYYVVLVTGGSVAAQFVGVEPIEQSPRYLEKILNSNYNNSKNKPFIVLNGGEGAWRQPQ